MKTSGYPHKKHDSLFKIFSIIETLQPAKQLELLTRLASEKLPALLYQLIIDLPENKRISLLEDLKDFALGKRATPRKKCTMTTDYAIGDRAYRNFVKDISETGVFVQTSNPLTIGDEIVQSFSLSNKQIPFKFTGEIVRSGKDGFGVKFKNLTQYQKDILQSIFKNMD